MANDDLFQLPAQAFSAVLGAAESGRKVVTNTADAIVAFQRAAVALEQLVTRVNRFLDDVEGPVRALAPELARTTQRMQRMADLLEPPIEALLPGLLRAAATLDSAAVRDLPETLDAFRSMVGGIGDLLAELPRRLGPMADLFGGADGLLGLGRLFGGGGTTKPVTTPAPASSPVAADRSTPATPAPEHWHERVTATESAPEIGAEASPAASTPAKISVKAGPRKAGPAKRAPKPRSANSGTNP